MSEFPNPVRLGFRVSEVAWREETKIYDQGRDTDAIPLRLIFADELKRTLWLAIKAKHITSQYFNHDVTRAAESIRRDHPVDPRDLHLRIQSMTGAHWDDTSKSPGPDKFCEELFPFVLSVLNGGNLKLEFIEQEKP